MVAEAEKATTEAGKAVAVWEEVAVWMVGVVFVSWKGLQHQEWRHSCRHERGRMEATWTSALPEAVLARN